MVEIAYLGYFKAFDLVCLSILQGKLVALGFYSCIISCTRGFLQDRLMSLSVAKKMSQEVEISSWVPQGLVLGSLLFLICANFITSHFLGS